MFQEKARSLRLWLEKTIPSDDAKLLDLAVRIATTVFLIDDIIEYRSYSRDLHIYLPTPVIVALNSLPVYFDWVFSGLHVAALVILLRWPRLWPAAALVVAITTERVLSDLMRFQPFIIMYTFTVLMAALPFIKTQVRLQTLRIMVVGVYFWAGFHKLNARFYLSAFPWFISPYWNYPQNHFFINVIIFGISLFVPIFESLIGIFLVFRRTRFLAACMAFIMLVTVLSCLGPVGRNWNITVWPWNVYLFLLELVLFIPSHTMCTQSLRNNWLPRLAALIFMVAPFFGIFGLWPAPPSFKLYSGNVDSALIFLDKREKKEDLPPEIATGLDIESAEMQTQFDQQGLCPINPITVLDINSWLSAINVSLYFNADVYKMASRGLCPYLQHPETAVLRIVHPSQFLNWKAEQIEEPLCPKP